MTLKLCFMMSKSKICISCGRTIEYRKKWRLNWEQVKYCSDECRKNKNRFDYRNDLLKLTEQRYPLTICPSEILPLTQKTDPLLMEHVRRAARLLFHEGQIEILQKNKPVDPDHFKGPIRLRRKKNFL